MPQKRKSHPEQSDVDAEFDNVFDSLEEKITFANRAPLSSDKGRIWINYAGASGSRWYFRHPNTGVWTTP